jgi:RNA recognition motif-containing protein
MQAFSKYGKVESIKMPKGSGGVFKGFAYITYSNAEEAIRAFAEMDNKIVLVFLNIFLIFREDIFIFDLHIKKTKTFQLQPRLFKKKVHLKPKRKLI